MNHKLVYVCVRKVVHGITHGTVPQSLLCLSHLLLSTQHNFSSLMPNRAISDRLNFFVIQETIIIS